MKQVNFLSIIKGWFILLMGFAVFSCSEAPIGQTPTNTTPPAPLTSVEITPLNGGAYVTYTMPVAEDLSYVKCEYVYNGVKHSVRSSIYKDYLNLEGFGKPEEIEISLTVVNHSEVSSTPVTRRFTPLEPPITGIRESLEVQATFGGVNIVWDNPTKLVAGIAIYIADEQGQFEFKDVFYSTSERGVARLRGLPDIDTHFSFVVFDKYNNSTDAITHWAKPLFEMELDKKNFKEGSLAGDNTLTWSGNRFLSNLFDGNHATIWVSGISPSAPQYFTIDLGVVASLSRFVLFTRYENSASYGYNQFTPEKLKVYGTDVLTHAYSDPFYASDLWKEEWIDLVPSNENEGTTDMGIFVIKRPSGLAPATALTQDDVDAINAGFEFNFETVGIPPIRYLRFEVIKTFSNSLSMEAREIEIYGSDGSNEEGE